MVKEVNQNIFVNDWDYPDKGDHHCNDPEKKKLVEKLAKMITDSLDRKIPGGLKENHFDFWILDRLLTKEEVKFMLSFKKRRVGYTTRQLAKMNKMTKEEAQKIIDHLIWIGILEQNRDNEDQHIQYWIPKWVIGSGEYMVEHATLCDDHPEVATMFNLAPQEPLELTAKMIPPGGAGIGMHTIPVESAIEATPQTVSVEYLSHWLQKYDKFCTMVCACRKAQRFRGEGVGDIEGYMCIGIDDIAEFLVETGKDAHYITREEALEIIMRAEKKGYVHQIVNVDGPNRIVGICNCSPGSCYGLRTSQLFNTPNMSASAWRAHVDHEKCVACGKCVEVCPAGAAKLGQKICHKDGSKTLYPMHLLPDDTPWGEDKWSKAYREENKINCYESGTSPCKTACPAHIAVQGYIQMASEGKYAEAVRLIRQDNPFPAVCGAVCNRRCEDRCTRGTIDKPLAIDEIKKFVCQYEKAHPEEFVPDDCYNMDGKQWTEFPIAVIGSGPAGLTCAYYLRKEGYPVTVFEKEAKPGGMMMNGIPNFRVEKDIVQNEIDIITKMGAEIKCGVEVGKDVTIEDLRKQGYKAFYVAPGLQSPGSLGIPGEDAEGVIAGIDYVKDINLHGPNKLDGRVVVIGGGNIASDIARTIVRQGAKSVDLYCLESYEEMPMGGEDQELCESDGIKLHGGWGQTEILKDKKGKVCGINFRKCLSVKNSEGRFDPKFDDSTTESVECEYVVFCIGQKADHEALLKGTKVEFNRNKTIKADPVTYQTAEPDIFVGGDVYTGQKFIIDAVAAGRQGAVSINRYVHPGQSLTIGRDLREFIELDRDDISKPAWYDDTSRQVPGSKKGDPAKTMDDLRLPLTEEQVKAEASRCLKCGATTVDTNQCIGCGLCTTRCEFDAIHLTRDMTHGADMYTAEETIGLALKYQGKRIKKIMKYKKTGVHEYPIQQTGEENWEPYHGIEK